MYVRYFLQTAQERVYTEKESFFCSKRERDRFVVLTIILVCVLAVAAAAVVAPSRLVVSR